KKSGYEDYTETVRVYAGKTVSVSKTLTLIPTPTATMTPAFGYISVFSRPFGASIYVDGNYKGTTPEITTDASIESNIIKVSVGIHTIKLKKSGYEDYTETVRVSAGETVSIYKKLVSIATPPSTTTATSSEIPTITIFTKIPIEYLIGIAIIILIIGFALSRKGKQKPTSSQQKVVKSSAATLNLKSAYEYKGAKILYKIKVENSNKEPVSDIKVHLFVPEVFISKEKEKTIALLKPKESKTVTFEIRPTKECGECDISGRATYYDYASKKEKEIYLEPKTLSIICPMLKEKDIDAATWKNIIIGLKKAEETTKEIPIAAKLLFEIISDLLKEMNLFRLEPTITSSEQLFRATAKFYGEGVKGLKYACSIEVIGGHKKSKLILKAYAEKEEALIGFYYGILDEMEKRVKVKSYIEDSIVQYYLTQTTIQDSVVIRSQIGIEKKKCPKCGNEVQAGDKFCMECGFKLR
ncbi:MAG: PEGA domain-containing protein, partial [Methanosarcinales archaeon]